MSKRVDTEPEKPTDHIDQIRDIIFGAQHREYERRFEKLESTISSYA